jgi:3-oxoacyl-[acyl-carrier protein] reductase
MDLNNKVAIITGSNRGIGRGLAEAFAKAGASVVVNYPSKQDDIFREEAFSVVENILASGGQAMAVEADVILKPEVEALVNSGKGSAG